MKILIACEESQAVCIAFREARHEAYSCDILDCSGSHPEWHIKGDAIKEAYSGKYDMMIAHPPCTYLTVSGARWLYNKDGSKNIKRWKNKADGLAFFIKLYNAPIGKICLENPIGMISSEFKKPSQIIQPYYFGDEAQKTTCLWLKNLPLLIHYKEDTLYHEKTHVKPQTYITGTGKTYDKWWFETCMISDLKLRAEARSKTFPGIAKAMAEQWGNL